MEDVDDPQNVSISQSEEAEFTCNFTEGDNNVTIKWIVGGEEYNCSEYAIVTDVYNCYTSDSQSVLQLKKLVVGDNLVLCVLDQNIPDNFQNDDWFEENLNLLTTRIATLTIMGGECRQEHMTVM